MGNETGYDNYQTKMKSYKQCCSEVAIKHKLGKSLVTGHRSVYWEEAAEMYVQQFKQLIPLSDVVENKNT